MKCATHTEFVNAVGLIEDPKSLKKVKLSSKLKKRLMSAMDSNGSICAYSEMARLLNEVVEENPDLHVITECDSDDGNGLVYANRMCLVNRNAFFLGTGDRDENIYFDDTNCFLGKD